MTPTMTDRGAGEQLSRSRRRNWWLAAAVYTGSAVAAGVLAERVLSLSFFRGSAPLSPNVVLLWVAIAVTGFSVGCWLYWRAMDEVEIRDNLIGAFAAVYTYAIALPAWWLLWKGGVTSPPNPWIIYLGSLGLFTIIYAVRRFQAQFGG